MKSIFSLHIVVKMIDSNKITRFNLIFLLSSIRYCQFEQIAEMDFWHC